ncbi:hypothetical protein ACFL08_03460 [Patescibacteria group bacterium]
MKIDKISCISKGTFSSWQKMNQARLNMVNPININVSDVAKSKSVIFVKTFIPIIKAGILTTATMIQRLLMAILMSSLFMTSPFLKLMS